MLKSTTFQTCSLIFHISPYCFRKFPPIISDPRPDDSHVKFSDSGDSFPWLFCPAFKDRQGKDIRENAQTKRQRTTYEKQAYQTTPSEPKQGKASKAGEPNKASITRKTRKASSLRDHPPPHLYARSLAFAPFFCPRFAFPCWPR